MHHISEKVPVIKIYIYQKFKNRIAQSKLLEEIDISQGTKGSIKNNFINIGHQENVYHNTMKYHLTQTIITCCKKSTNRKIQVGLWSKRNCWWGYKLDQSLFKIILIPFSSLYVKNNQATEGSFTIGVTY